MRSLSIIILFSVVTVLGFDGDIFLEPKHIKGTWVRMEEKQSPIPGLYMKDSTIYRIGIDKMPVDSPAIARKDPLSLYVQYDRGQRAGFILDPKNTWEPIVLDLSGLTYELVMGLPGPVEYNEISFSMPHSDTLVVKWGNEVFGLKRRR